MVLHNPYMGDFGEVFNSDIPAELRTQRGHLQMTIDQIVNASGISKSAVLHSLNDKRQTPISCLFGAMQRPRHQSTNDLRQR